MGRLFVRGGLFHVMGRGLERRNIFNSDEDKADFLLRLDVGLKKSGHACYAWALMDNHYHLLLRQSERTLCSLMGPLLGGYALCFNRRHGRSGYLYQGRYRSILCEEEGYFLELLRYIHLNPVQAGMVNSLALLADYPWTGHGVLLGKQPCSWQRTKEVLDHFCDNTESAQQQYLAFVADGLIRSGSMDFDGGGIARSLAAAGQLVELRDEKNRRLGDERILGSSDFVDAVLSTSGRKVFAIYRGWAIKDVVALVCGHFNVNSNCIHRRTRGNACSEAKSLVAFFAFDALGMTTKAIANYLGMSHQGASKTVARGRVISWSKGITLESLSS
jgi:REP element-mobilizing transposase RayT